MSAALSLALALVVHFQWLQPGTLSGRAFSLFYWPHFVAVDWSADKLSWLLSSWAESGPPWIAVLVILVLSFPVSCLYVWLAAGVLGRVRRG